MEDDVEASEAKEKVRGGGGASGDNDDENEAVAPPKRLIQCPKRSR